VRGAACFRTSAMGRSRPSNGSFRWKADLRPVTSTRMPIKSLYVLTTVLYVASGLLLGAAAWSWRNLARRNRLTGNLAFRKPARLTAISLAMLAGTVLCDALVGALSSPCAALSPCDAQTTPNASVTVHLEEAKPSIDAALIDESNQLTGDCNNGRESACGPAGRIASALESRGYCRPDASGRWEKTPVCAQIIGKPDLKLGLPIAGSANATPQSTAARGWRRRMRAAN
jgi:hypothetical protein